MLDLFHTLQDLQAWGVSLVAQTGLQFVRWRKPGDIDVILSSGRAGTVLRSRSRGCREAAGPAQPRV